MGLKQRIDEVERRVNPAQKVVFNIHVPPEGLTREEHRAWSDELKRTVEGYWTTLNIGDVDEDKFD
jgi:hypothetical protein